MQTIYRYSNIGDITQTFKSDRSINNIGVVGINTSEKDQSKMAFHDAHIDLLQKARGRCDVLILALIPRLSSRVLNITSDDLEYPDGYDATREPNKDTYTKEDYHKLSNVVFPSLFETEYDKLCKSAKIDYVVGLDAPLSMIEEISSFITKLRDSGYKIPLEDNYLSRIELVYRFYKYFIDLIDTGK